MKQGSLFFSILFIFLVLVAGTARADSIKPGHFFDFEYAKNLWTAAPSRPEMEVLYYGCDGLDEEVFTTWERNYGQNPQKALKTLESHPEAEAIKRCYDTRLTYDVWDPMYDAWRDDLFVYGSEGWNKDKGGIKCVVIRDMNIFTGRCDDLPDWRHPENAAEDEEDMARGNNNWWSKKAKENEAE